MGRPQGKADKVPVWKGSSTERWQEYRCSLVAWFYANNEFITQAQIVNKIAEMFKGAGDILRWVPPFLLLRTFYMILIAFTR
jgi:hypothetical protein